eukprot:g7706.t1
MKQVMKAMEAGPAPDQIRDAMACLHPPKPPKHKARRATLRPTVRKKVYNWDFVMLIPVFTSSDRAGRPENCTCDKFVDLMIGLRRERLRRSGEDLRIKEFLDNTSQILRTNRCYMSADGQRQHRTGAIKVNGSPAPWANKTMDEMDEMIEEEANPIEQDNLRSAKIDALKEYMRAEYINDTGSSQPCSPNAFSQLIAKAIVRRLLQACGLETAMKYSVDGDEIIVCLRADERDLAVAADRSNYKLQCLNQPFHPKRQMPKVAFEHPEYVEYARKLLQERVDDDAQPMLDPGMFRRGWQDFMLGRLTALGHDEEAGYVDTSMYFAPYADYQADDGCEHLQLLFRHYRNRVGNLSPFRQVDRIRLSWQIIRRHLNIPRLKHKGLMNDCFPLHDQDKLKELRSNWALNWRLHPLPYGQPQPLLQIRDYYGEKLALYFAWLEHYTKSLVYPSLLGLGLQWAPKNGALLIAFGCMVSLWASQMTEKWKRVNSVINVWWGTTDFEAEEQERPEFVGELRYSPVTDQPEVHHVRGSAQKKKMYLALATCFTLMCAAGFATWGILKLKYIMSDPANGIGKDRGVQLAGIANAIWIQLGNALYGDFAMKLTDWENHRTQSEWERLLVTKTFLFRFINSYFSFFYIAFVKRITDEAELKKCVQYDATLLENGEPACYRGCGTMAVPMYCMDELSTQILMIFLTQTLMGNFLEMVMPLTKRFFKIFAENHCGGGGTPKGKAKAKAAKAQAKADKAQAKADAKQAKKKKSSGGIAGLPGGVPNIDIPSVSLDMPDFDMTSQYEQPELEAKYSEYRVEKEAFDDYAEMVVQYGFVTLFVVAFPLTPVLALANNVFELHVDAVKLTFGFRRPFPHSGQNIGQWALFMNLQSSISVVTNIAIIVFTTELFAEFSLWQKWLIFVLAEHGLLMAKIYVQDLIHDVPEWAAELVQRHQLITAKVFKGLEDEEDEDEDEDAEELVLEIHENDFKMAEYVDVEVEAGETQQILAGMQPRTSFRIRV